MEYSHYEGISSIKLTGRSVWDVQCSSKDSWCWNTILELRQNAERHMSGIIIYVWHDRWDSNRPLAKLISKRDIYSAGFSDQSKLCDVVDANGWKWSHECSIKSVTLSQTLMFLN